MTILHVKKCQTYQKHVFSHFVSIFLARTMSSRGVPGRGNGALPYNSQAVAKAALAANSMTAVRSLVKPLFPITQSLFGPCSTEKYPCEWRIAIPASLMRVDSFVCAHVPKLSHPLYESSAVLCQASHCAGQGRQQPSCHSMCQTRWSRPFFKEIAVVGALGQAPLEAQIAAIRAPALCLQMMLLTAQLMVPHRIS